MEYIVYLIAVVVIAAIVYKFAKKKSDYVDMKLDNLENEIKSKVSKRVAKAKKDTKSYLKSKKK